MLFDGAWYALYAHLTNFDTPLSGVDIYDSVIVLIGLVFLDKNHKILQFALAWAC